MKYNQQSYYLVITKCSIRRSRDNDQSYYMEIVQKGIPTFLNDTYNIHYMPHLILGFAQPTQKIYIIWLDFLVMLGFLGLKQTLSKSTLW